MKTTTIEEEIKALELEARWLEWQVKSPHACPRAAWDAEDCLKAVLDKLADLKTKAAAATGSEA